MVCNNRTLPKLSPLREGKKNTVQFRMEKYFVVTSVSHGENTLQLHRCLTVRYNILLLSFGTHISFFLLANSQINQYARGTRKKFTVLRKTKTLIFRARWTPIRLRTLSVGLSIIRRRRRWPKNIASRNAREMSRYCT